ncbi:hypothetical protein ACFQU7_16515 [Pseudoroseomonas wenyumeiae]
MLGALEEGVWPQATDPGPWMSRPMRADFGLPEPEARIGRVAADFLLAAASAPNAVLARARKRAGSPTVPSRWLTRLETFLGGQRDESGQGLALPQSPAVAWAAALDMPEVVRPAPAPPPARRPRPARARSPSPRSPTSWRTPMATTPAACCAWCRWTRWMPRWAPATTATWCTTP